MPEWILGAARFLQFASALVLFGSASFMLYAYNRQFAAATPCPRWPRGMLVAASALGAASTFAWLLAEAALLTGSWHSWALVASQARFGLVASARTGILVSSLLVAATMRSGTTLWISEAVLGAMAVASFAWTGHGTMGAGIARVTHLAADILHLLAAGVWIGALLPLAILSVQSLNAAEAGRARLLAQGLVRFSAVGPLAVSLLILSGLVNTRSVLGQAPWQALTRTAYGLVLLAKIGLLLLMLALAAVNRFRLTPALNARIQNAQPARSTLERLRMSLVSETVFGLLVLIAVSVLGMLEPPVSAG